MKTKIKWTALTASLLALGALAGCCKTEQAAPAEKTLFEQVAERPPLGWNSFDAYDSAVTEEEFRANVDFMAEHLKDKGWEYAVIDYIWWSPDPGGYNTPENYLRRPGHANVRLNDDGTMKYPEMVTMDENGRLWPAVNRFPSAEGGKGFKPLADYVHSKGLKFGLHIMRGIHRLAYEKDVKILGSEQTAKEITEPYDQAEWLNNTMGVDPTQPGSQAFYNSLFALFAEWEVDYIKADDMMGTCGAPFYGYHEGEIEMMRKAIENSGRPMVLSLSCGEAPIARANHLKQNANMWRVSADFWDRWSDLRRSFQLLDKWSPHIGPHHFPDADMIPFGHISLEGRPHGPERMSKFNIHEQHALMSLFTIARSPLMIGANLPTTPFETIERFFQNEETLYINQFSYDNRQVIRVDDDHAVWIARDENSDDRFLALFNLSEQAQKVTFNFEWEMMRGTYEIRDLWDRKEMGRFSGAFAPELKPHEGRLYRIKHAQ